jgi:hypothetical protein
MAKLIENLAAMRRKCAGSRWNLKSECANVSRNILKLLLLFLSILILILVSLAICAHQIWYGFCCWTGNNCWSNLKERAAITKTHTYPEELSDSRKWFNTLKCICVNKLWLTLSSIFLQPPKNSKAFCKPAQKLYYRLWPDIVRKYRHDDIWYGEMIQWNVTVPK